MAVEIAIVCVSCELNFCGGSVEAGYGAHPESFTVGMLALPLEVEGPGREAGRPPPSSTELTNTWSCTSTHIHLRGRVLNEAHGLLFVGAAIDKLFLWEFALSFSHVVA